MGNETVDRTVSFSYKSHNNLQQKSHLSNQEITFSYWSQNND